MRTFKENSGVRLPQAERAGSIHSIRDAGEREQVLDACFTAHLGYDLVKTGPTSNYAKPVRPEALSTDELEAAIAVMSAQVARIREKERDAVDEAERANAAVKASVTSQLPAVREGLRVLAEKCPLFAGDVHNALRAAEDRAHRVQSSRVLPQDSTAFTVPASLGITLDACQAELKQRTAVEQAESAKLRAMLQRAGISL